jgi:hypothetical protein
MTAKELFEDVLPRILRENPERAREFGGIIAFDLKGKGGGVWTVDARSLPPKVESGKAAPVVCTVTAEVVDFEAMLAEPKAALPLYQQGKIRVVGDSTLAASFHRLLR